MTNPQERTLRALADGYAKTASALGEKQSTLTRLIDLGLIQRPDWDALAYRITAKGQYKLTTLEKTPSIKLHDTHPAT